MVPFSLIPFSDPSERDRIFPWMNLTIIAVNFAVFFYELSLQAQGNSPLNTFFNHYALVPCEYTNHCSVPTGTPQPFFLTLFTSMFMHAGWLHILGNMLYLFVFGDNIENSMGHIRYLFFYLLCGLGASGLEIATSVSSHTPGLGASGAIAGVLGAYLVLYPTSRVGTLIPLGIIFLPVWLPAWVLIGFWFALQLIDGVIALGTRTTNVSGGVAYWAHVGGFIAGIILVWLFRHRERVGKLQRYHAGPYGRWGAG